jgi:hypothetical protein
VGTDGTGPGTHELTGIAGASSSGVLSPSTIWQGFAVFNGEVLFLGYNDLDTTYSVKT